MLKNLSEKYISVFTAKDLNGLAVLMDENFVLEDPLVKRIEGKKLSLEAISKIFSGCNSLSFTAKNIFQDGNTTFIEFVLDLDETRLEGVDIIQWHDGKMLALRAYLNIPGA